MSRPANLADLGTLVPPVTLPTTRATHGRFTDVKTYANRAMPKVKIGQVYEDLDPRSAGRRVQVLKIGGDGKVMVRTLTPRTCPPRTPSRTRRDTTGAIHFIALRRFRENSRGFRLIRQTTIRSVHAFFLASRLSAACNLPVRDTEIRAADALIGLLGNSLAHEYMDAITEDPATASYLYAESGVAYMLEDAIKFADETGESKHWVDHVVANAATARTAAQHA